MGVYIREDQAHITVDVMDKFGNWWQLGDGNSWATFSGADLTASGGKTRPGGMGREVALGGPASRGNATLEIQHSPSMMAQHAFIESRVGRGRAKMTAQYLDDEGNVIPGATFIAQGMLGKCALPASNFNSGNAGMYSIDIECDEEAS